MTSSNLEMTLLYPYVPRVSLSGCIKTGGHVETTLEHIYNYRVPALLLDAVHNAPSTTRNAERMRATASVGLDRVMNADLTHNFIWTTRAWQSHLSVESAHKLPKVMFAFSKIYTILNQPCQPLYPEHPSG